MPGLLERVSRPGICGVPPVGGGSVWGMVRMLVLGVVLVALSGCSGSGGTAAPTPSIAASIPTTSASSSSPADDEIAALRAAVVAYSDAFLTGDGKAAYGMLSARCRTRMTAADFGALVSQAGDLYGSTLPLESFDARVSGDMARVSYTYSVSALDQAAEPWVREGGSWREDDC